MIKHKKFLFSSITVFCVSATTVVMQYPPDTYKFIILAVVAGYLGSQSVTDIKKTKDTI